MGEKGKEKKSGRKEREKKVREFVGLFGMKECERKSERKKKK